MTERRRPTRRGRGPRPQNNAPSESVTDSSPYREDTPTSAPVPNGEVLNGGSTEAPATDAKFCSIDNPECESCQ